jgi:hypothetical protein
LKIESNRTSPDVPSVKNFIQQNVQSFLDLDAIKALKAGIAVAKDRKKY